MQEEPNSILNALPKELREQLSESSMQSLKEAIEQKIEERVSQRVKVAVDSANASFNESAKTSTTKLVNLIEHAHMKQMVQAVKKLNENHKAEIARIHKFYRGQLVTESNKFQKRVVSSLRKFINERIERLVPSETIEEAVRNRSAMRLVESLQAMLAINNPTVLTALRKPVLEAKNRIAEAEKKSAELLKENADLTAKLNEQSTAQFLEECCQKHHLDAKGVAHMKRVFNGANMDYIKENFTYGLNLYKESVNATREQLRESVLQQRARENKKQRVLTETSRSALVQQPARPTRTTSSKNQLNESRSGVDTLIDLIDKDNS